MEKKICIKCNIEKNMNEFRKTQTKYNKNGYRNDCKDCERFSAKLRNKKYREKYKEKVKLKDKLYYEKNKIEISKKVKEKNNANPEYRRKYNNKWKLYNTEYMKEYMKEYNKKRRAIDPLYNLSQNIRRRIRDCFKKAGYTKESHTYEIIGCSQEELKIYLEKQFQPWMNWSNRGLYNGNPEYGWDIDHIEPLFPDGVERTFEDIIRLNHYTNLQPLCSYINRNVKRNRLDFL